GVELVYKNLSKVESLHSVDTEKEEIFVDNLPKEASDNYYWKLPEAFLGDRLASYGGYLNFTIDYSIPPVPKEEREWLKDPLAVIKIVINCPFICEVKVMELSCIIGSEKDTVELLLTFFPFWNKVGSKFLINPERPLQMRNSEDNLMKKSLKTKKKKRRRRARRKDMMQALTNVSFILLKANYRANVERVSLLHISMSHAVPNSTSTSERATVVEQCECPEGYGGLSCQYCSSGYTKNAVHSSSAKSKRNIKECKPCECNGHADSCHQESGKCLIFTGNLLRSYGGSLEFTVYHTGDDIICIKDTGKDQGVKGSKGHGTTHQGCQKVLSN
ncbi:Basement membrane-specific heparan sulfate proteoglycan core protein, partial [Armadillidium nasatum]